MRETEDTPKSIKLFIYNHQIKYEDEVLAYSAGEVCQDGSITNQQIGAEETFAVGMPVYDEGNNELGRLSVGSFEHLNYHAPESDVSIPVHYWKIDGYKANERKKIKTYYQVKALLNNPNTK